VGDGPAGLKDQVGRMVWKLGEKIRGFWRTCELDKARSAKGVSSYLLETLNMIRIRI
jgi:hypothetical protein